MLQWPGRWAGRVSGPWDRSLREELGSPNGRATRHVKKTRTQLARQMMGGSKGAKNGVKWQGFKYL